MYELDISAAHLIEIDGEGNSAIGERESWMRNERQKRKRQLRGRHAVAGRDGSGGGGGWKMEVGEEAVGPFAGAASEGGGLVSGGFWEGEEGFGEREGVVYEGGAFEGSRRHWSLEVGE